MRYRELKCDCGEPAVEVYCDRLGEWPMCSVCLKRYLEPDGEELLPDHNAQEQKDGEAGAREYPFALTRRQYEIARLSPKSDKEIGEKLSISPSTVNAHLRVIFKKLGVQSRHEIRHVLSRAEDDQARLDNMGWEVDGDGDSDEPGEPATVTLSISKQVDRFSEIRDFIRQIASLLEH
jgi:DNA-binding CsgD family transcriptional regulator